MLKIPFRSQCGVKTEPVRVTAALESSQIAAEGGASGGSSDGASVDQVQEFLSNKFKTIFEFRPTLPLFWSKNITPNIVIIMLNYGSDFEVQGV